MLIILLYNLNYLYLLKADRVLMQYVKIGNIVNYGKIAIGKRQGIS
jgi:hypothetical protein